jgi:hypothetical protein
MNNLKNYLKKTIPIIKKEIYDSNKKTLKIDDLDDFQRFQIMNIYSKILQKIGEDKELVEKLKNSNFFKQIECLFNTKDINNLKQILTEYLTTNKREIITNFFENVCEMQVNKNKLGGYKNKTCKNKRHRKSKKSKKNKRKLSKKNKLFFGGAYPDGFLTGQFDRCEICFDEFDDQNNYVVLHANENNQDRRHNYHRNCLTSWTNTNVRSCDENRNIICPYCQQPAPEFRCLPVTSSIIRELDNIPLNGQRLPRRWNPVDDRVHADMRVLGRQIEQVRDNIRNIIPENLRFIPENIRNRLQENGIIVDHNEDIVLLALAIFFFIILFVPIF